MLISIIIPVYNVEPYIEACLRSVMAQTYTGSLECIVVDDRGSDGSMEVAERLISQYTGGIVFKICRHEKNRGLSAARNTGMEAAAGDYVYFLDSDDELTPDSMEKLSRPVSRERYDVVIGNYKEAGVNIRPSMLGLSDGTVLRNRAVMHSYHHGGWYPMAQNKLYHTGFIKENGLSFMEGIIHEDELWSFRVACLADAVYVVGDSTYLYRIREGSITNTKGMIKKSVSSYDVVIRQMYSYSKENQWLANNDVFNFIQNFQIEVLNKVQKEAPELFGETYTNWRSGNEISWLACCRQDGFDMKKQIRDFHYLLPVPVAIQYMRSLLRIFDRYRDY